MSKRNIKVGDEVVYQGRWAEVVEVFCQSSIFVRDEDGEEYETSAESLD